MGGEKAPRTVEEGADTICWLADPATVDVAAGMFYADRKLLDEYCPQMH
jgi:hypothetical protein